MIYSVKENTSGSGHTDRKNSVSHVMSFYVYIALQNHFNLRIKKFHADVSKEK